ncbi:hypothetical protein [Kribbella sp. NPDC050469]|uniref:alpha-L-rhamnosidase-related protein n=1 Tax=Kribbella sp. NPDC050469 TaxID=3364116 RepID=UPI0037A0DCE6
MLIDLDQYVCAYPVLDLEGGRDAEVRVHWQESLYETDPEAGKGHRDVVAGKLFGRPGLEEDGIGDLFIAGGGEEQHSTLWWQSGRYVEVLLTTAAEPFRTLQACSHKTTMDCPYYEQRQCAGDTRLQCLVAYATTGDDALARQALRAFARSQEATGLVASRMPSRQASPIPPFTLWWVAMVHDFALWRGDRAFVAELMPGVRAARRPHLTKPGVAAGDSVMAGYRFNANQRKAPAQHSSRYPRHTSRVSYGRLIASTVSEICSPGRPKGATRARSSECLSQARVSSGASS